MSTYEIYKGLYAAVLNAVAASGDPDISRFRPGFDGGEQGWRDPGTRTLPAADFLESMEARSDSVYQPVLEAFTAFRHDIFWEQTYKRQHGVVSDNMLASYGFAEIIGKTGPLISDSIRCGIAVWGPDIDYPMHRHDAEEIYVILAGSAMFTLGDNLPKFRSGDDVVFVSSGLRHSFTTTNEALAVLYFWQGGDLRQISSFS
jgi:mannose-6-phosphate isomerase-like protein (cupin superfamily)